jgi:hypothetical protein
MRTALIETLFYITVNIMSNDHGLRDAHVDDQLTKFLPIIVWFVIKNLENDKYKLSPVTSVDSSTSSLARRTSSSYWQRAAL